MFSTNFLGRRDILTRGGQLEVAGVVVGQWGGQMEKGKSPRGVANNATQVLPVTSTDVVNRCFFSIFIFSLQRLVLSDVAAYLVHRRFPFPPFHRRPYRIGRCRCRRSFIAAPAFFLSEPLRWRRSEGILITEVLRIFPVVAEREECKRW